MARYTELEKKHIQLDLDLKLVQENFHKAKDEAIGTIGENLTIVFIFLPLLILTSLPFCRENEGGSDQEGPGTC